MALPRKSEHNNSSSPASSNNMSLPDNSLVFDTNTNNSISDELLSDDWGATASNYNNSTTVPTMPQMPPQQAPMPQMPPQQAPTSQYSSNNNSNYAPIVDNGIGLTLQSDSTDAQWQQQLNEAAQDNTNLMAEKAEKKAVQHADRRIERDSRDARRGHESKLQPNAVRDVAKTGKKLRIFTVSLLVIIIGLACVNVLIPRHEYTTNEIAHISRVANGSTGFPMQEGAGIATQFIQAYLSNSDTSGKQFMQVFYNGFSYSDVTSQGGNNTGSAAHNLNTPVGVSQIIKSGPYVYDEKPISVDGTTATYKVGALVYRNIAKENNTSEVVTMKDSTNPLYRWVFYQVDLVYDKTTRRFAVSQNSPTRMPEPTTWDNSRLPEAKLPGDGEENDTLENDDMQKLVTQFFTSWAASDQTALSVMLDKHDSTPAVKKGLGGVVELSGAPSYKVYGPPETDPYYRVLVTAVWKEGIGENTAYTQTSSYVLKLKKSNGKFYVIDLNPYYYTPSKPLK